MNPCPGKPSQASQPSLTLWHNDLLMTASDGSDDSISRVAEFALRQNETLWTPNRRYGSVKELHCLFCDEIRCNKINPSQLRLDHSWPYLLHPVNGFDFAGSRK